MRYVVVSSSISELELPTSVQDQARAMSGELATTLTTDRLAVLIASAHAVEDYADRAFWPGVNGAARGCTAEIEVDSEAVQRLSFRPFQILAGRSP